MTVNAARTAPCFRLDKGITGVRVCPGKQNGLGSPNSNKNYLILMNDLDTIPVVSGKRLSVCFTHI